MSFDRGTFHCDSCPENIDTDIEDFNDALTYAKRHGWRSYIGPDKEWAHSCPSCKEDWAKRNRQT